MKLVVSGSASSDPDGSIISYDWNFGDGTTGTGATVSHTYSAAGTFTVTLVVTDNAGAQGTASATIAPTSSGGGDAVGWNLATRVPADLKGIHFVDQNTGWVVGLDAAIFKATDGGQSWTKQTNIIWKGSAPAILPWIFDVFPSPLEPRQKKRRAAVTSSPSKRAGSLSFEFNS